MSNIVLISAGMSDQSSTSRLGEAIAHHLRDLAGPGADLGIRTVELRPLAHQIVDAMTTGFASGALAEALEEVKGADAVVALTPTYQSSYSGLFKSFIDVFEEGTLAGKPVLIGATGGTPRHALVTEVALRPLFTYLHADPVPTAVFAATEDWGASAGDSDGRGGSSLRRRIRRAASELLARLGVHTPYASPDQPTPAESDEPTAEAAPPSSKGKEHPASRAYPRFVDFETLLDGVR